MIRTLGSFKVLCGGRWLPRPSGRALRLLTLLLCVDNHRLPSEQVGEILWPETGNSRNNVYAAAHDLRTWLGQPAMLSFDSFEYSLNVTELDADGFEAHCIKAKALRISRSHDAVRAEYEAWLSLYNGPFLPTLVYFDWINQRRARIERALADSGVFCGEVALLGRDYNRALELSTRVLWGDITREDAGRLHMRALAGLGRRSEALRFFLELKRKLADDLGCRPDPATQALRDEIASAGGSGDLW